MYFFRKLPQFHGWWWIDIIVIFGLAVLCYFFIFANLGNYSLRMWDESRNGINALEMMVTGNPIVTYYQGSPDLWNTKPPLLIWLMVISFKLLGINEFTLRLPSAAAATLVVMAVYVFCAKVLKSRTGGLLSSLILLSAYGFTDIHIGRTGDYDALLTLWATLALMFTFVYLQFYNKNIVYFAVACWTLAVLTKGTAGLLMIPGVFIYLMITRQIRRVFGCREVRVGLAAGLAIILAYYLGREGLNHGYLRAIWAEEIFNRMTNNNEEGVNWLVYYWRWAANMRFQHWVYLVPLTISSYFLAKVKLVKQWTLFAYVLVIFYYLTISLTQTKQLWYDAQLYPLVAMLLGMFFVTIFRRLKYWLWVVPALILVFYLQRYLRTNLAYIQRPDLEMTNPCYQYGYFFRNNKIDKNGLVAVDEDANHCMPFTFYMEKEGIERKLISQVVPGDTILSCDPTTLNSIKREHQVTLIFKDQECEVNQIGLVSDRLGFK